MVKYSFSFPSTEEAFIISDDIFGRVIDTFDVGIGERQRLKLIVSELYMNAYLYGHKDNASKIIDVSLEVGTDRIVTIVKNEGRGMSERRFKELVETADDFESDSGRGIRIVHKLSDNVKLFRDETGKFCIESTKKLKKKPMLIKK
ncbi:MAG: ATP-binding protein [Candidatus Zixiibacteriota bacterium]|nr:MAG: ATP-binding protein [candidate division Zixibacteria bacterium]